MGYNETPTLRKIMTKNTVTVETNENDAQTVTKIAQFKNYATQPKFIAAAVAGVAVGVALVLSSRKDKNEEV